MDHSELLDQIRNISEQVSNNRLNRLRLEEELLINLAQNPNQPMPIKALALKRVAQINEMQLTLLGRVRSKGPKL